MDKVLSDTIGRTGWTGFLGARAELPGLLAQGRTVLETLEIELGVARKLMVSHKGRGDELFQVSENFLNRQKF